MFVDYFYLFFYGSKNIYRRQDAPQTFDCNASIYIYKRQHLINKIKLLNNKTSMFLMPRNRSTDIDDIYDLNVVKFLIKKNDKFQ